MASCRYLNWLMALSVAGLSLANLLLPLPVFLYIAALTYLGSVETTAHSKVPLAVSAIGMAAAAVAIVVLNRIGVLPHTWALLLPCAALPIVLWRLLAVARDFTPGMIQQTMKLLILGIIPLDAILVFSGGPWWCGLMILTLLIPGRALARLIYIT